jgi:Flp pilus assembly protein CpaB
VEEAVPASTVPLSVRARRAAVRPAVRRSAIALLAAATGIVVASLVSAAGAERDRWGTTRPVAVARHDLQPGDVVDGDAAEVRSLPAALVPEGALADLPRSSTVRQPMVAGEPLVAARLAPEGLTGVAALVPAGHRAIAVPIGPAGMPPVALGDRVDVVTVVPVDGARAGGVGGAGAGGDGDDPASGEPLSDDPAFALAEGAAVVDVGEQAVSVAVPERAAARVAWAIANGTVVLTLAGG